VGEQVREGQESLLTREKGFLDIVQGIVNRLQCNSGSKEKVREEEDPCHGHYLTLLTFWSG
jgi:hypothetical protein